MLYRSLGSGEWPSWVRSLRGKSGVYIIRSNGFLGLGDPVVLYVGESHSGQLYDTLTRHFQEWVGKTAGQIYPRGEVTVGVVVTPTDRAPSVQTALIARLNPSDNTYGRPDGPPDVPF
jgi:hypothetical protein